MKRAFIFIVFVLFLGCDSKEKAPTVSIKEKLESRYGNENRIVIKYEHSMRIPHQQIICTLYRTANEEYKMRIETIAMIYQETIWNMNDNYTRRYVESEDYINSQIQLKNEMKEFAKDNINVIIDIDKNFFEQISNEILKINFLKIAQDNNYTQSFGLDGSSVIIEYGSFQYFMSINVWDPRNTKGEVEKVNGIVLEVFRKANVDQWYD